MMVELLKINQLINQLWYFLLQLRIKIKIMPENDFQYLLMDKSLNMQQRLYLLYFRYY